MNDSLSIAIIGAGAMGSRFGFQLFKAGYKVTLFDIWQEHIETIQQNGLKVKRGDSEETIKIKAYHTPEVNEIYNAIFLFTKSQHTEDALKRYQNIISEETYVITLQNGIGNVDVISKYVDLERVIIGTTTYSSDLLEPGSIKVGGSGEVLITQLKENESKILGRIEKVLNDALLHTRVSPSVMKVVWEKLAFNAAINTLTAVTKLTTGQVGNHSLGKKVMRGIVLEVEKVATQLGIEIDAERVMETLQQVSYHQTAGDHLPSMLQDVLKKQKTEIEAINGAVIREAKKYNIAVPYNFTVYGMVKMIEDNYK